jgi:hypothetical protein
MPAKRAPKAPPKQAPPENAPPERGAGDGASKTLTAAHAGPDPVSDDVLRGLPVEYAAAPDMPSAIHSREVASLARLAKAQQARLRAVGIGPAVIDQLARFSRRLVVLERDWQKARKAVHLTPAERKLLAEAEALDNKLVAGGRWGLRKDPDALEELARIAEGSGLVDTVQDLVDGVALWDGRDAERAQTDVTDEDLARAAELAELLGPAAEKEGADVDAAAALELRNRCFWAADELANDVRQGGRYAFRLQPKMAAKFVSRYRTAAYRRGRRNAKAAAKPAQPAVPANGATPA